MEFRISRSASNLGLGAAAEALGPHWRLKKALPQGSGVFRMRAAPMFVLLAVVRHLAFSVFECKTRMQEATLFHQTTLEQSLKLKGSSECFMFV